MTKPETSPSPIINFEALSFAQGAPLLLKRALPTGQRLGVQVAPEHEREFVTHLREFVTHLRGWRRAQGHEFFERQKAESVCAWIERGAAMNGRWQQAERAGVGSRAASLAAPSLCWGCAARSAAVEAGGQSFHYPLHTKAQVWADNAPKLYAQAVAAQCSWVAVALVS